MRTKVSCLLVAILGAIALVSSSGAVTQKANHVVRIDVSTRASIIQYLRSIHVNPTGVVIQRGSRNYAGASCPGTGWTCTTTAHPVVQVASSRGRNSFICSTVRCAVVQVSVSAPPNIARCVESGSVRATTCSITQSSARANNVAIVYQSIDIGLTRANSTATITQTATGASNGNTACVTQNVKLSRSHTGAPFTMDLNAHQSVIIKQHATGSGANSARYGAKSDGTCNLARRLAQNQTLTEVAQSGGAITQTENANDNGPNLKIDIEQNQGDGDQRASGTNYAAFVQTDTLTATANSSNGSVDQIQSSADGGLEGTINQYSSGVSTAKATQTETQCAAAATTGLTSCGPVSESKAPASLTQRQSLRVRKGLGRSTQTGNASDTFTVNQTSTQTNTTGTDQTSLVQADCSTDGNCTVDQTATLNGDASPTVTTGPLPDINITTYCTSSDCTPLPPLGMIVGNSGDVGGHTIQTWDASTGSLVNSFVPGSTGGVGPTGTVGPTGAAVAVEGNEVFYTELGPTGSGGIHVAPFNGGSGGHDLRVLPNPTVPLGPTGATGIQDLDFSNGDLFALTGYSSGPLQVWKLDPSDGHQLALPVTIDPSAAGSADGFTVLPDGNFLINDSAGSCTYREYVSTTGHATGQPIILDADVCTGVDTDGASLFFATDFDSFTRTDLSGTLISRTDVGPNDVADLSLA